MEKRVLSIRIPADLYEELKKRAQEEGLTLTQYVEALLRQALGWREKRLEKIEHALKQLIAIVEEIAENLDLQGIKIDLQRLRRQLQQD